MQVKPLPEPRRKEIFLALVDAQDHGMSPAESRKVVAERFGVSEDQVRQIEREGLDNGWPPL
jgi:DNA-directed RNA polymerase sigma subunit (sigma70/sigma32)